MANPGSGRGRGDQHQPCGRPPEGLGGSPYSGGSRPGGTVCPPPWRMTRLAPAGQPAPVICRTAMAARGQAANALGAIVFWAPSQAPALAFDVATYKPPQFDTRASAPASSWAPSATALAKEVAHTTFASETGRGQAANALGAHSHVELDAAAYEASQVAIRASALAQSVESAAFASEAELAPPAAGLLEGPAAAAAWGALDDNVNLAPFWRKGLGHPTGAVRGACAKKVLIRADNFPMNIAHNILLHFDAILKFADVGSSKKPAVNFEEIAIVASRGLYSVKLHLSFLRSQGQANDFKIQYSSTNCLFLLPKSNNPLKFVVITCDTPICKGETLYPHIVIQFETEAIVERKLTLSRELLDEKYKDRLEEFYKVFTIVLHSLSDAEVTRPGSFRNCQDKYAVKSSLSLRAEDRLLSLRAEDGLLYPLEMVFLFLPKLPTLILHEEIEFVQFEIHDATGANMSSHYFDLPFKLKIDKEDLFTYIQRYEHHKLFNFINGHRLKIMNHGDGQATSHGAADVVRNTDDVSVDPRLEHIKNQAGNEETDEEDKDDSGSPTNDSGEQKSDASDSRGEKKILDLGRRRSVLIAFLFISLLGAIKCAKAEDVCPIQNIDSSLFRREVCPVVNLSSHHWSHAKRELLVNKDMKISDVLSFKVVGFLLVAVSSIRPWYSIEDITIHMTDNVLFWEVKMFFVWAFNFISSSIHYLSWALFDLMIYLEDTSGTVGAWPMMKNLVIALIYSFLLGVLLYSQRMAIKGYMRTQQAIHMWVALLMCSVSGFWLWVGFGIRAFGMLGWIAMVPMVLTKWITAKRFKWVSFMFKAGGLIGVYISHEVGGNWWYERAYELGIVCRVIELILPGVLWLILWVSRAMSRLSMTDVIRTVRGLQQRLTKLVPSPNCEVVEDGKECVPKEDVQQEEAQEGPEAAVCECRDDSENEGVYVDPLALSTALTPDTTLR